MNTDLGGMTGFTASSKIDKDLDMEKRIEQYYLYFTLLNKRFDNFSDITTKELNFVEEKLNKIEEKILFYDWYFNQSWLKHFIWKLRKLNFEQLNNIRKNGVQI